MVGIDTGLPALATKIRIKQEDAMTDKEPPPSHDSALEREPTEFDAIETWEQWLPVVFACALKRKSPPW